MWVPTIYLNWIEHDFKNVGSVLQETINYDIKGLNLKRPYNKSQIKKSKGVKYRRPLILVTVYRI